MTAREVVSAVFDAADENIHAGYRDLRLTDRRRRKQRQCERAGYQSQTLTVFHDHPSSPNPRPPVGVPYSSGQSRLSMFGGQNRRATLEEPTGHERRPHPARMRIITLRRVVAHLSSGRNSKSPASA